MGTVHPLHVRGPVLVVDDFVWVFGEGFLLAQLTDIFGIVFDIFGKKGHAGLQARPWFKRRVFGLGLERRLDTAPCDLLGLFTKPDLEHSREVALPTLESDPFLWIVIWHDGSSFQEVLVLRDANTN